MSQRYPDINSQSFSQQVRSTLLSILLPHLPLGIVGRNLDDALAYDILSRRHGERSEADEPPVAA